MRRIHVYYRDDFGYTAAALTKYDDDGDYYDADEVDAEMARLRTALAEAQREIEELRADRERVDGIIEFGLDVCLVVPPENPDSTLWPTVSIDLDSRDAIDLAIREARRGE